MYTYVRTEYYVENFGKTFRYDFFKNNNVFPPTSLIVWTSGVPAITIFFDQSYYNFL